MAILGDYGHCVICGIESNGLEDFICENCGHPEKIIFTCDNCGHHIDLTDSDIKKLEQTLGQKIRLGNAIVSSVCPHCREGEGWIIAGAEIKIFNVKLKIPE